jgi:phosphoribosylglycinamide formyltransferase 1
VLNLVVLISGGGSNLRALLDAASAPGFPARIVAVGADREAEGFSHAEHFGIPTFTVPFSSHPDRESWGAELLQAIRSWDADLVVLSGFMRLLPGSVARELSPRCINTHPAYLPEFPGAHAVRDAIAAGATESGASVIVVDDGVDTGPVLAQERVIVHPGDDEAALHDRIKIVERRLLEQVVVDIADGTIELEKVSTP